jgi:hypothetical protein
MFNFKQFNEEVEHQCTDLIAEKLILYNQGKKYGQVVFLAGGAGSGKGFALKNFIQSEIFKIRDVDEWKKQFQELAKVQKIDVSSLLKRYSSSIKDGDKQLIQTEILDKNLTLDKLDLRNSTHVYLLHVLVKAAGVKERSLELLLANKNPETLPNILFDVTLKDVSDINSVMPQLIEAGYKPHNIHITWVLTKFEVAVQNNAGRDRVVPEDILLLTHKGAAKTMLSIMRENLPDGLDGSVHVILNNKENTIAYVNAEGKPIASKAGNIVVKDFMYLLLKKENGSFFDDAFIKKQLYKWIMDNVPQGTFARRELNV